MRLPRYLSPSSLATWESDREAFYLKYLAEDRPPSIPQANYMAIGSAFDAYVKAALHAACFGVGSDPRFEFDNIFADQVEEHNRDWALETGKFAFECYKYSGVYDELLAMLLESTTDPLFEFKVEGTVGGVPVLGKPDCCFTHRGGANVILDWKVNGYCSKHGASPYKGFSNVRAGWDTSKVKAPRGIGSSHKMYVPKVYKDLEIGTHYLEDSSKDWADQLSIYGWLLGYEVGSESTVVCIDQLVCKPAQPDRPLIRVATHRCRISEGWQKTLLDRLVTCWKQIQSGHIFEDRTFDESVALGKVLDMQASAHAEVNAGSVEEWVCNISRGASCFRQR